MSLLKSLSEGLRSLFRKERVDKELDEELRGFLEMAAEEKIIKEGMNRKDALRAVHLERGNLEVTKEVVRSAHWETQVGNFVRDIHFALRHLRKDRRFALVAILVLALGIGSSTAIFSVVNAALLRPLPYHDPTRLVWADEFMPRLNDWAVPNPEFTNWNTNNHTFEGMLAYGGGAQSNLTGAGEPERIETSGVTASFLTVLGIRPG
jgi:hypothetical protein